jgi:hypothetical protein
MTTRLKYTEEFPRIELRNWRQRPTVLVGEVLYDHEFEMAPGQNVGFIVVDMRDYRDHCICIAHRAGRKERLYVFLDKKKAWQS